MPEKFKNKYRIASTRLKDYDYSQDGLYFVTICAQDRECYFGEAVNCEMGLSDIGRIAEQCWREIPDHFPHVELDEYIVMPNHVHGIIVIDWDGVGGGNAGVETQNFASPLPPVCFETQNFASLQTRLKKWQPNKFGPQSKNLASIIRGFKIGVTKYARQRRADFQWQPRYYEHIIRNEKSLNNIREYIRNNPVKWGIDRNNFGNLFM